MYKFGPYGPNHSTAATFAFRKELLKQTKYDDNAALAEEKAFLKGYTIPFVQLDSMKSILVFSHVHNSFDKKTMLENPNPYVTLSEKTVDDFVKEPDVKEFFMRSIDGALALYEPGRPEHKPEVHQQMLELKKKREEAIENHQKMMQQQQQQQQQQRNIMNANPIELATAYEKKLSEQTQIIHSLMQENAQLTTKVGYLENKIKEIIQKSIQQRTQPLN
jgi:hypothetical protein